MSRSPRVGQAMRLALRPVAPNDYIVLEDRQPIGRIRLARERTPPICVWHVTVTIPGPPFGLSAGACGCSICHCPIRAALMPRPRRIFSSTFCPSEAMRTHQALSRESWHVVQPVSCLSDVYAGAHVRHRPVAELPSIKTSLARNL